MFQSHFSTLRIAAGGIEPVNIEGKNFWVVHAPVDLDIRTNGGEFATYSQGTGLDNMPNNGSFSRLEIRNPSLGTIFVRIYVGGPLYRDARSSFIEPKTIGVAQAGTTIAGGATVTLTGIPTGLQIRRKSFQVTNLDPAEVLQIRDTSDNVLLSVFGRTNIILPISEEVRIHNATGVAIACNISEIFWTL